MKEQIEARLSAHKQEAERIATQVQELDRQRSLLVTRLVELQGATAELRALLLPLETK